MAKSPPDPNLETITDLVIEFRIERVPSDAMERGELTGSLKGEIDALKAAVVKRGGTGGARFRDRRVEKAKTLPVAATPAPAQGLDATGNVHPAVRAAVGGREGHGLHLADVPQEAAD